MSADTEHALILISGFNDKMMELCPHTSGLQTYNYCAINCFIPQHHKSLQNKTLVNINISMHMWI